MNKTHSPNADTNDANGSNGTHANGKRKDKRRARKSEGGSLAHRLVDGANVEALAIAGRDLGDKVEAFVKERPFAALAGATALGAVLGGVVFSKAGRLVFLAAAGAIATEVWKAEGKIDVRGLLDRLTSDDEGDADGGARAR